jgi:hypothetical protein
VAILSLLAPIGAPVHLGDGERAELVRAADPALLALRGGDGTRARIGADPRAELRRAERCSPELAGLRGGDVVLSDRDVKVILITAAAILLLIAIF